MKIDINAVDRVPYFMEKFRELTNASPNQVVLVDMEHPLGWKRAEIDDLSARVYRYLRKRNIGREDFVMICLPRGGLAIIAMIGVWRAGAALTVVESDYAPERIAYIRQDCGCKLVIDSDVWQDILTEEPLTGYEKAELHDAAFAVYTSGSSGKPKGVLHEYGNIKYDEMSSYLPNAKRGDSNTRIALIAPLNFIAATKTALGLFYNTWSLYVIDYSISKNPLKLQRYYEENNITLSFLSPSILRALKGRISPSLQVIHTGSEPANGIFVDGVRLVNNYSMSEAAFTLCQFVIDRCYDICPIGRPSTDMVEIHLLDEDGREVPQGEAGEICFENPFFRGYVNMPEMTERVMRDGLFHSGDLARRNENGDLILLGRSDDMMKINGNRIEPAEIERSFLDITKLDWACAKGFEEKGRSFICLYYTGTLPLDEETLNTKLRERIPYYMMPAYYIHLDAIPMLPNGKVNKKSLMAPDAENEVSPYEAPKDDLETSLCNAMAQVLKRERVGVLDDFFRMGGDSLSTMELIVASGLEELTASDVYNGRTPGRIASGYRDRLRAESGVDAEQYEITARTQAQAPSLMQISFLDMQLYSPTHPIMLIPVCYRFDDPDAADKVCAALNRLMDNSPIFSSTFIFDENNRIVIKCDAQFHAGIEVTRTTETELENIKRKFVSRFPRILGAPLYRAGVYVTEKACYMLVLFHHILIDGMGVQVFLNRFLMTYMGKALPMDTFYSALRRNNEVKITTAYQVARDYMESTYGNVDWTRNFVPDRSQGENEQGICPVPMSISGAVMAEFEKRNKVTRNQLCVAAILLTMAKCTGKTDVIITSAFHNRLDPVTRNALGIVIKKLPTGIRLDRMRTMEDVFSDIQTQSVDNIRYRDYEYALMNEKPFLNDFMVFTYETAEINSDSVSKTVGMTPYPLNTDLSHATIRMFYQVFDTGEKITGLLGYSKRFFTDESVAEYARILAEMTEKILNAENLQDLTVEHLLN